MRLLERDEQLAALDGAVAAAAGGSGRVVLLTGEAGVGKTSVVRAFAGRAAGARFLIGSCDDLATARTLGPIWDAAPHSAGPLRKALSAGSTGELLFTAMRDELLHPPRPAVLVVEDVHWADEATVDVLAWLARRVAELPAVVVLTYRDQEVGRDSPLQRVLGRLSGVPVLRLALGPLSETAVATLAEASGLDTGRLYAATAGNPFFVTEVVAAPEAGVPPTVADAVNARVRLLSPSTRDLLDQLAVLSTGADEATIEELVPDSVAGIAEAERHGVLTVVDGVVGFRHELARRALEQALPTARARQLHRRALDLLITRDEPDISLVVHHADAINDRGALVRFGPLAAREAASAGARREAVAHYRRVLRHEADFAPQERAELLEAYAVECYVTGRGEDAIDAQQRALALRASLPDRARFGASLRLLSRMLWWGGNITAAEEVAAEAVTVLETAGEPRLLGMAYSNSALLAMLHDRLPDAERWAARAVALGRETGDVEVLAHSLNNLGFSRWHLGDADEGQALLQESLAVALAAGLDEDAARAYVNLGGSLLEMLRYPEALAVYDEGIAFAERVEQLGYLSFLTAVRAQALLDVGRWEEAEASALLTGDDAVPPSKILALSVLGRLQARRGAATADATLDEAWQLLNGSTELQRLTPLLAARAELAWLQGRLPEIAAELSSGYQLALRSGQEPAIAELGYWLGKAGGQVQPCDATHPWALQAGGAADKAAERWREVGRPYDEALALLEAGGPDELLRALSICGDLGAEPLARRVRAALRAAGVTSVPRGPVRSSRRNPFGLTARQLEVLRLLAGGLTNTEIAAHLVVSVRTVDHHVATILEKLSVPSRKAAAARAAEIDL